MPYIGNTIRAADDYRLIDDISSGFNGSTTSFALQVAGSAPVPFPKSPQQVLISVNGVIQEPDPTGASGFNLVGTNIVFSSAPTNGHAFFGIIYATADYLNAGGNFPSGALGSPSITFIGDENTGLYRKSGGSVGFVSDATEIANFDSNGITISSGNLIIPGDIIHSGDTNTKLSFPSNDTFRVQTNGAQRLDFDGTETVFNEDGADIDFRVEGDSDTNLIRVDAANDHVGVGTPTARSKFEVFDSSVSAAFNATDLTTWRVLQVRNNIESNTNTAAGIALGGDGSSDTETAGICGISTNNTGGVVDLAFLTASGNASAERMRILSGGNVGIGTASPAQLLSLKSSDPRILITETTNNSQCLFDYAAGGVLEISVDDNNVDSGSKFQVRIDGATAGLTLDDTGLGIGTTAPQTVAHLAKETAKTNEVEHMLQLTHTSSGTTTTGFGTGIRFQGERNNGALQTIGDINFEADVNSGSVISAALVFKPALSGSATERMRLDSTGALGLGVTPKNNSGNYRQLQIGLGAHFYGRTDDTPIYIVSNGYRDGSDWKYTGNTTASQISLGTNITFETASSGTADNAITFNEQLRVTSSGVGIGTTSPDHNLSIIAANSATPRFGFQNPDENENINFSTYHDSNGIYCLIGANMKLDANGNTAVDMANHRSGGIHIDGRNNGGLSFLYKGSSGTTVSTAMTIKDNGAIGMGTTSVGSGNLTIKGTSAAYGGVGNATNSSGAILQLEDAAGRKCQLVAPGTTAESGVGTITNHNFTLFTSNTQRAMFMSGNLTNPAFLVGTTNNSLSTSTFGHVFFYDGTVEHSRDAGASDATLQAFGNAGSFRTMGDGDAENTNGSYTQISDIKYKENVVDANSQWDDIKAIKVRNFNFKSSTGFSTHKQIGIVAQELELTSPALVKTVFSNKKQTESHKSVLQSIVYMKALKALQEAMVRIETLETEVAALKAA